MAVKKRGGVWYGYFNPFLGGKQIGLRLDAENKAEARQIEAMIIRACRTGEYQALDSTSREACARLFVNQGWELPGALEPMVSHQPPQELTLGRACEVFLKYPEVRNSPNRLRHAAAVVHLIEKWGEDFPVKSIWIPEIKAYQMERLNEDAAPSTVNKEKAALSRMFQVLVELRYTNVNPARLVKNLSERSSQRETYISFQDFLRLASIVPLWLGPVTRAAYYSGMRRGEIVALTRKQVNLRSRMILLRPEQTKEESFKRVPIHMDLAPVLEDAMKVLAFGTDRVFLIDGRPVVEDSFRRPWVKAVRAQGFDPAPTFHDLRHSFVANCRRSGMPHEILQAIVGHWNRTKPISERYGRVSDSELVQAIDRVSFDHGETEVRIAGK